MVLRKAKFSAVEKRNGKHDANWEGPYKAIQVSRPSTYKLEDLQGKLLLASDLNLLRLVQKRDSEEEEV